MGPGRPKGSGQVKRSMTIGERENLKEYIGTKENLLNATSEDFREGAIGPVSPRESSIQKEKLQADIKHLKGVLEKETPDHVSNRDVDKLEARRRQLEEKIIPILETREEIEVTNRYHPAWAGAIKKGQIRARNEPMIAEYRELCKRLNPDDPEAGSLDAIRKDK